MYLQPLLTEHFAKNSSEIRFAQTPLGNADHRVVKNVAIRLTFAPVRRQENKRSSDGDAFVPVKKCLSLRQMVGIRRCDLKEITATVIESVLRRPQC